MRKTVKIEFEIEVDVIDAAFDVYQNGFEGADPSLDKLMDKVLDAFGCDCGVPGVSFCGVHSEEEP